MESAFSKHFVKVYNFICKVDRFDHNVIIVHGGFRKVGQNNCEQKLTTALDDCRYLTRIRYLLSQISMKKSKEHRCEDASTKLALTLLELVAVVRVVREVGGNLHLTWHHRVGLFNTVRLDNSE